MRLELQSLDGSALGLPIEVDQKGAYVNGKRYSL